MTNLSFQELCNGITDEVERCLPEILRNPDDFNIAQGNCVLCIMNAEGETSMRMYGGTNRPRQREAAMVAQLMVQFGVNVVRGGCESYPMRL